MEPTSSQLPCWRGFNLLELFIQETHSGPFLESDFDTIADWGFDFVRLPMDYRIWTTSPGVYNETALQYVDQAITWGSARGIHVNLCLHRAPGYSVNPRPPETLNLWADDAAGEQARAQFAAQWAMFARRCKGIPNRAVSFDLVNEPAGVTAAPYVRAVGAAVDAIRAVDPTRLIIADGLQWGTVPVPELIGLHVAQSTRGYAPAPLSHYKAGWVAGSETWQEPTWPLVEGESCWDKQRLQREQIAPWQALEQQGVGVHVGEWGAHNQTPHHVVLAWMRDQLSLWRDAGWGWALWNLRGTFGVLDSDRADVNYESFHGHKLDRRMLEVLLQG